MTRVLNSSDMRDGLRYCRKCKNYLDINMFNKNKEIKDGIATSCKECVKVVKTASRKNRIANRREQYFKAVYNITLHQLKILAENQNYRCYLCNRHEDDTPNGLHVDHDHKCCPNGRKTCGKCIRGLLCNLCNTSLGVFENTLDQHEQFLEYINKPHAIIEVL